MTARTSAGLCAALGLCAAAAVAPAASATSPNCSVSVEQGGGLLAVSADAPDDVWAVGTSPQKSIIEHWTGTSWHQTLAHGGDLLGVKAFAPDDVWAVGSESVLSDRSSLPITEHWDGSTWTPVTGVNPGASGCGTAVFAVDGTSTDDLWAVGVTYPKTYFNITPFIERWDGTSWQNYRIPNMFGILDAVSVVSADDAWAVGTEYGTRGSPLTEHWDGTRWTKVTSVNPGGVGGGTLYGVSAISADDVWAVGSYNINEFTSGTFIEHWDGTRWTKFSRQSQHTRPEHTNTFQAVSGDATNDVWTVGYRHGGVIEHWNGTAWAKVGATFLSHSVLFGVATLAPDDAWAVGYQEGPLIAHWDGTTWTRSHLQPS